MKFNMTSPCKECPFIKGSATNRTLRKGRLDGIVRDIMRDMTFTCHKTLELPNAEQEHCAGALIYLERAERPNQMMRIAERLGMYDLRKLKPCPDLIDPL